MKKTLYILVFLLAGCNNEHELTMERGIQYYEWDMIEESILEFKNVTHALGAHSKKLDYSKIKLLSITTKSVTFLQKPLYGIKSRFFPSKFSTHIFFAHFLRHVF